MRFYPSVGKTTPSDILKTPLGFDTPDKWQDLVNGVSQFINDPRISEYIFWAFLGLIIYLFFWGAPRLYSLSGWSIWFLLIILLEQSVPSWLGWLWVATVFILCLNGVVREFIGGDTGRLTENVMAALFGMFSAIVGPIVIIINFLNGESLMRYDKKLHERS